MIPLSFLYHQLGLLVVSENFLSSIFVFIYVAKYSPSLYLSSHLCTSRNGKNSFHWSNWGFPLHFDHGSYAVHQLKFFKHIFHGEKEIVSNSPRYICIYIYIIGQLIYLEFMRYPNSVFLKASGIRTLRKSERVCFYMCIYLDYLISIFFSQVIVKTCIILVFGRWSKVGSLKKHKISWRRCQEWLTFTILLICVYILPSGWNFLYSLKNCVKRMEKYLKFPGYF